MCKSNLPLDENHVQASEPSHASRSFIVFNCSLGVVSQAIDMCAPVLILKQRILLDDCCMPSLQRQIISEMTSRQVSP